MVQKDNLLRKRKSLVLMVLFLIIFIIFGSISTGKSEIAKASDGRIDLSSWNFEKDGLAKLDGQWEIYSGELLEPKDFKQGNYDKASVDYFQVPSSFVTTVNKKKLPKFGYATLRLKVKLKPNEDALYGIKSQYILSASKIWINGQLVTSTGKISRDADSALGSFEHQIAFFKNDGAENEIVIQMSNYNNVTGKVQNIYIGYNKQLKNDYIRSVVSDAFIIGCLFIMGIYHFALYYKRPSNKATLYFGVFCLLIALRNAIVGERIIFDVFPNISFSLFNKLAYLTVYCSLPFIIMFFKEILGNQISSKLVKLMNIISIVVSLVTIFTRIQIYDNFLLYYEIWILALFVYILYMIIKAVMNKNQGALIILFGFTVFVISVIHDIILQAGIIYTNSLIPAGFFIFIFSQSYLLASNFSDAFMEVEKLVEENKAVYTDELTGLLNRRGFYERGEALFKDCLENENSFTLFYGDLNKLKIINDTFGHKEGDEAIKRTASLLRRSFGKEDIVARVSGDEFIAIALNKSSNEDARSLIENINNNFQVYNATAKKPYRLSISLGYSICTPDESTYFEAVINEADDMLYEAKASSGSILR
ncbi:diguanylate cyclase [Clostridium sp. C8-1-8]|uniref:diguanylate cyclase n=1 Tax=Clostridium sp. C8-1-8 TaxID=2698831 RepID=UPI001370B73E|nr:diguanylate cyclase [Clostridium sp. C8-1-8]